MLVLHDTATSQKARSQWNFILYQMRQICVILYETDLCSRLQPLVSGFRAAAQILFTGQPVRPAPRPPNHYLPSKANHHHSRAHCPPALEWRSPLSYLPNSKTNVTVILPNPPILISSSVSTFLVVHSIPEDTILTSSCRGRPNNGSGGWLVRLGGAVRAAWTW